MTYLQRKNPLFSACGLHCGLCPRHYTQGASKCPGCAGKDFSHVHPACGVLSCCQRHGLEYCVACAEYPCRKYDGADEFDSFISHQNQLLDFAIAKKLGLEEYAHRMQHKRTILQQLLQGYDDGRRKSFFCLAVNLLSLEELDSVMLQLAATEVEELPVRDQSAKAVSLLQSMASSRGIVLKLRKKPKI